MKKTKIRYEVDPHNQLVCEKTGKKSDVRGFRTVLDGEFEIGEDNTLSYNVKKSQGIDTPQQLKLRGKWALDDEHNLVLTLDKWGNQIAGNKLTLESELIDAKYNKLTFSLTSKDSDGNDHIYIVNLGGRWQADEYNRLTFKVEKESGPADRITLQGGWEVNNQNQIIYTYEKKGRGKRERITQAITFKGHWDIIGKNRLIYVLNKEINSGFDFQVSVGKPAERGLQYELGVGAAPSKKTITLFGNWKVDKNLGLLFEMPCAEGQIRSIVLGGWAKMDKNSRLEVRLENKLGEDLGIDVKLSRNILEGQGEAFIQALGSRKEVSIVAGLGFRW
ncbi:MAG: hypothetical protein M0R48_09025 [Candidatus Omnitrophica bacterium]|jgi:hypothetical protein|nr:hypothetical protein [Candidatus Omnitrophota bacterium]